MTYMRTENRNGYQVITTVSEDEKYIQKAVWPDGVVTSYHESTLQAMGWPSLREFLLNRNGFERC